MRSFCHRPLLIAVLALLLGAASMLAKHAAPAWAAGNLVACNYVGDPNCAPGETPMGPMGPTSPSKPQGPTGPTNSNSSCAGGTNFFGVCVSIPGLTPSNSNQNCQTGYTYSPLFGCLPSSTPTQSNTTPNCNLGFTVGAQSPGCSQPGQNQSGQPCPPAPLLQPAGCIPNSSSGPSVTCGIGLAPAGTPCTPCPGTNPPITAYPSNLCPQVPCPGGGTAATISSCPKGTPCPIDGGTAYPPNACQTCPGGTGLYLNDATNCPKGTPCPIDAGIAYPPNACQTCPGGTGLYLNDSTNCPKGTLCPDLATMVYPPKTINDCPAGKTCWDNSIVYSTATPPQSCPPLPPPALNDIVCQDNPATVKQEVTCKATLKDGTTAPLWTWADYTGTGGDANIDQVSTAGTFRFTPPYAGAYRVTVKACSDPNSPNMLGPSCTPEDTTLTVNPIAPPTLDSIVCQENPATAGQAVSCNANVTKGNVLYWSWQAQLSADVGTLGGFIKSSDRPIFVFTPGSAGDWQVSMTACSEASPASSTAATCTNDFTALSVSPAPAAAAPDIGAISCSGAVIRQAVNCTVPVNSGTVRLWSWSVYRDATGDGGVADNGSDAKFTFTVLSPGTRGVHVYACASANSQVLHAADPLCASQDTTVVVEALKAPSLDAINCQSNPATVGQAVSCSANVTAGSVLYWSWVAVRSADAGSLGAFSRTSSQQIFIFTPTSAEDWIVTMTACSEATPPSSSASTCTGDSTTLSVVGGR